MFAHRKAGIIVTAPYQGAPTAHGSLPIAHGSLLFKFSFEERSDDPIKEISFNHFQFDFQSGFLKFLYMRFVEISTTITTNNPTKNNPTMF